MALLANAQMTVAAAPGTGTVTLGAATPGAQSWAAAGAVEGAAYSYRIEEGSAWEIGTGTYTSGAQLARTSILASSGNGAVAFGAGAIVSQIALPGDVQAPLGFAPVQQGGGANSDGASHKLILSYDGEAVRFQVDTVDFGKVFTDANAYGSINSDSSYFAQRFPCGGINIAASTVVTTDGSGLATVPLGMTMAAGSCFALPANGDYGVTGLAVAAVGATTASSFRVFVPNGANTTLRVNWFAWGRWR